jgi:hypothetical protein
MPLRKTPNERACAWGHYQGFLRGTMENTVSEDETISPEAIAAGAKVIWECFDGTISYGSSFGEHVAMNILGIQ